MSHKRRGGDARVRPAKGEEEMGGGGCPAACLPERWLLLAYGCCWLQIYWSSLRTVGTSVGIHPTFARMEEDK